MIGSYDLYSNKLAGFTAEPVRATVLEKLVEHHCCIQAGRTCLTYSCETGLKSFFNALATNAYKSCLVSEIQYP